MKLEFYIFNLRNKQLKFIACTLLLWANYLTANQQLSNSTTCIPELKSSYTINVRDLGAKGDGTFNDTAVIQAAMDQVAESGGTVFIPDGIYMIDAVIGLSLSSNMTLRMSNGAVLKAFPNNETNFSVLRLKNVSKVNIIGGTIEGERAQHQGTVGEWGHNLALYHASKVHIDNLTVKEAWGDGLYIADNSKNITVCSLVANHNRRQGMSIISANNVLVKHSLFKNTQGTLPEAGIDIEPDANLVATNINIESSEFINNTGAGIMVGGKSTDGSKVENVTAKNNTVINNGRNGYAGIYLSHLVYGKILQNKIQSNTHLGINITEKSRRVTVHDNQIINNGESGIQMYITSNNTLSNNIIANNYSYAIIIDTSHNNRISNNLFKENKAGSISESLSIKNYFRGNTIQNK